MVVKSAHWGNILEERVGDAVIQEREHNINVELTFRPFEIKTLIIELV